MKAMVISDIHGNIEALNKAIQKFYEETPDYLLILGDFSGYYSDSADFEIAEILNDISNKIIAVRGNCDDESIEDLLHFSLEDFRNISINDMIITITHGNYYNHLNLPPYCGSILLTGHTHCGSIEKEGTRIYANPGSISKPRDGTPASYLILDDQNITLKDLTGNIIISEKIKDS